MATPGLFADLFNNEKYSDLTIYCKDKKFKVHRVILATQCKFIDRCCTWKFSEESTGFIKMNDDDPVVLENMLPYLYSPDLDKLVWPGASASPLGNDNYNLYLIDLFVLADKYELEHLQDSIVRAFNSVIVWQSAQTCVESYLRLADLPSMDRCKSLRANLLKELGRSSEPLEDPGTQKSRLPVRGDRGQTADTGTSVIDSIANDPGATLQIIKHLASELQKHKQPVQPGFTFNDIENSHDRVMVRRMTELLTGASVKTCYDALIRKNRHFGSAVNYVAEN